MSDYLRASAYYISFLIAVYTVSFMAALGWKHGRGVKSVTNITVNAIPK